MHGGWACRSLINTFRMGWFDAFRQAQWPRWLNFTHAIHCSGGPLCPPCLIRYDTFINWNQINCSTFIHWLINYGRHVGRLLLMAGYPPFSILNSQFPIKKESSTTLGHFNTIKKVVEFLSHISNYQLGSKLRSFWKLLTIWQIPSSVCCALK